MKWRGDQLFTLEDIIKPGLNILFFGCNPAQVSVDKGHYHQGGFGKALWGLMRRFGFIPPDAQPGREDDYLLARAIGMTDIVKKPGPNCRKVDPQDYDHGRPQLIELLRKNQPIRVVCGVYKYAMEALLEEKIHHYGHLGKRLGLESEFFVPPFPPGKGRNDAIIGREFVALERSAFDAR